jgi:hypothetical protein
MVKGYRGAPMEPSQEQLYYDCTFGKEGDSSPEFREGYARERRGGGKTIAQVADHFCACGGSICSTSLYPVKAGYSLNEDCPSCMKLFADHLTCTLAGGAATEHLLRDEHRDAQSGDDRAGMKNLIERVLGSEQLRQDMCIRVKRQARDLVRREARAIGALASALVECGVLNGPDAEKIIKANVWVVAT